MKNDDKSVVAARITARTTILVAVITGLCTFGGGVVTSLISTGNLFGRPRVGTSAAGGEAAFSAPVLEAPQLYFSTKETDLSLDQCMKNAKDGLARAGLVGRDAKRYFTWGYQHRTTGLVWCHTDEKLIIFLGAGKDDHEASAVEEALRRSF